MWSALVLPVGFHYGAGSGSGLSHLGQTLAHAALWSMVGRVMFHAPVLVFVAIAAVAAIYVVRRRRGDRE